METLENKTGSIESELPDSKILNDGESIHGKNGNLENNIVEKELPVYKDTNDNTIDQSLNYSLKTQNVNKNEFKESGQLFYTNDICKVDNIKEEHKQEKGEVECLGNCNLNEQINGDTEINFQKTLNDYSVTVEKEVEDLNTQNPGNNNLDNEIKHSQLELAPSISKNETDSSSTNEDTVEIKEVNHLDENSTSKINHTEDINENNAQENGDISKPVISESSLTSDAEVRKLEDHENYAMQETADANITDADNFVDILGNGLLTKRVIKHGLGRETRPTHGDSVTIEYEGWNSTGDLIDNGETSFVLGDGDMIQAFDLGICLAERQEEFELKTDARFAYGSHGWEPHVLPNESLIYRIKLLRVDDAPDYTVLSHEDRMKAADFKRERGNYLYRREEYSLAVNSYSRAIKIIETDPDYKKASTDPTKADMYDLFVKVTNNLAAAQLKLESYDNVIETCNTILNYDASNVKALFRKGKSLTMKGNYDEAIPILKRALELENSKLIASEIQRCYQLKRAEDEQRARVCRKMFGTGAKETPDKGKVPGKSSWTKTVFKYSPYIGAVLILIGSIYIIRRL